MRAETVAAIFTASSLALDAVVGVHIYVYAINEWRPIEKTEKHPLLS